MEHMIGQKHRQTFNHTLMAMVVPIAFQNLMTALVSASDAIMLGFLEQEALSAVSLAGQVTLYLIYVLRFWYRGQPCW